MSKNGEESHEAELVDEGNNLSLVQDRKAEVMVNQSWVPLANKLNEINVRTYRKVVQQATGLLEDLKDHQRALADLRTVDMDIEADKLAKQEKVDELREITESNKQLKEQRQRIEKKALDLQEAEIEKRLRALQNEE